MSFKSFLEAIGHDFKKGLDIALPIAETAGETAVSIFAPSLGSLFNTTVSAVITAEQSAAALGKQSGSGPTKLASVLQLLEPVISSALADAGKANDRAAVIGYINSVVTILNAIPAPAASPAA